MKTKSSKSVGKLFDPPDDTDPRTPAYWAKYQAKRSRLTAKYAKDPNHRHTREEFGSYGPIGGGWKRVFYRCKVCHADLSPKGGKFVKTGPPPHKFTRAQKRELACASSFTEEQNLRHSFGVGGRLDGTDNSVY